VLLGHLGLFADMVETCPLGALSSLSFFADGDAFDHNR